MKNFLDDHPQNWSNTEYEELQKYLIHCSVPKGIPFLRELADKAGIEPGRFPEKYGDLREACEALIKEMGREGKLRVLVERAALEETVYKQDFANMLKRPARQMPITTEIPSDSNPQQFASLPVPPVGILPDPGLMPPGSKIPFLRNAIFSGREKYLVELAEAIFYPNSRRGGNRVVVLAGIGGIGKTQLAVEFCYRYGQWYDGVHWLAGMKESDIHTEVVNCGIAMGIPFWSEKIDDQVETTLLTWAKSRNRLIVIDSVENPEILRKWLPRFDGLQVLITSRQSEWPVDLGIKTILLGALKREESLLLLNKLTHHLTNIADEETLEAISEKLGDLPLAIDLAGRYLSECKSYSPFDYLLELEGNTSTLNHKSMTNWTNESPTGHTTNPSATFSIAWKRLQGKDLLSQVSRKVFLLAGFCASGVPIPNEILRGSIEIIGFEKTENVGILEKIKSILRRTKSYEFVDKNLFDRGLKILGNLGLLIPTSTGFVMHKLISEYARGLTDGKNELPYLAITLDNLTDEANKNRDPRKNSLIYTHVIQITPEIEGVGDVWVEKLWKNMGHYQKEIADFKSAKRSYERALGIVEKYYKNDDPKVAEAANNLGQVLHEVGDYQGAENLYLKAIQISQRSQDAMGPDLMTWLNNLASLKQDIGDLKGAKKYYEEALNIAKTVYGLLNDHTGIIVSNLGTLLQELGDLVGAKDYYEQSLDIAKRIYSAENPIVANRLNNLGLIHLELGNLAEARDYLINAQKISEEVYGENNPHTAIYTSNLGSVYKEMGDLSSAKECFERALIIRKQIYGSCHPDVANSINLLGCLMIETGDLDGAMRYVGEAIKMDREFFGPKHPNVSLYINNMGHVFDERGHPKEAKQLLELSLSIAEENYEPDHPQIGLILNNLGFALHRLGELQEAKNCFERSVRISKKVYGLNHYDTASRISNLASVLSSIGDLEKSKECYEQAIEIAEKVHGCQNRRTALYCCGLGHVLCALDELERAQKIYSRALTIFENTISLDLHNAEIDRINIQTVHERLVDIKNRLAKQKDDRE